MEENVLRGTFLWRGFYHEWLRSVLGFRLAHRISKFDSYISEESFEAGENWKGSALFTMGQDTGVDGNFMYPRGYFGAIYSPDLYIKHYQKELHWTDRSEGSEEVPYAISQKCEEIEIDLAELGATNANQYVIALSGISLETTCNSNQSKDKDCNSHGMWPYHFEIKLSPCNRSENLLKCSLNVHIARAWTPNKGGPPLWLSEILPTLYKSYNDRLDFNLKIQYTLIAGTDDVLHVTHITGEEQEGQGHDSKPRMSSVVLQGIGGGAYAKAASVVTGFSFKLFELNNNNEKFQRLGRYIGGWGFSTDDSSYQPQLGELEVNCSQRFWVPYTVFNTGVYYRTDLALVQLGDAAGVANTLQEEGKICNNSSEEAPPITTWKKCGTNGKPTSQSQDMIEIYTQISSSEKGRSL
ncbi:MAG: hypothetical protein F6K21_21780 [Symploca sp. SIO2D2]|nr:hypothetical protein [Symploca sp. SIO2D2]